MRSETGQMGSHTVSATNFGIICKPGIAEEVGLEVGWKIYSAREQAMLREAAIKYPLLILAFLHKEISEYEHFLLKTGNFYVSMF